MLHITQSTLSGQVKELEQRYGVKLFIRDGRQIELTNMGASVFDITREMFQHEDRVEQLFQSAMNLTTGELRIAADAPYIVTPLLVQFQQRYPSIHITISYGNSEQVMHWLKAQRCDVAILPNVADDQRLHIIPLQPDRLIAFVALDHACAEQHEISMAQLVSQRVILREKGSLTRSIFEQALHDANLKLIEVMEISSREGVCEAVAAGFGVGIISENELITSPRFKSLPINDAVLTHSELAVCLKQNRALQVTNAFMEIINANVNPAAQT